MYQWYADANICYVYLEDLEGEEVTLVLFLDAND